MSIVTISRGSYSKGKAVAEKLASKLGYECVSREIIVEASKEFNVPETKLTRALHDSPSLFDRFTYGKERYIAYIKNAFLQHIKNDNIVYHGLAGHFFLHNAPNVLKVRIIADLDSRIQEEMERENISASEAKKLLLKDDEERRKWSHHLYGMDTRSSSLYDLVIHINKLSIDDAVDIIEAAVGRSCFQSTQESNVYLQDLSLAAKVQVKLISQFPSVNVTCHEGNLHIFCKGDPGNKQQLSDKIMKLLGDIEGAREIEISSIPVSYA